MESFATMLDLLSDATTGAEPGSSAKPRTLRSDLRSNDPKTRKFESFLGRFLFCPYSIMNASVRRRSSIKSWYGHLHPW